MCIRDRQVQVGGIREHGEDDVVLVHLLVLGHLDRRNHVCQRRDAQQVELLDELARDTLFLKVYLACFLIEKAKQMHRILVADGGHGVGVADVVDPGDMLVADTLDTVCAKPVCVEGRALQGLDGRDMAVRVDLLEVLASTDGPRRASGGDISRHARSWTLDAVEDLLKCRAGHVVVPQCVAELLELVEHNDVVATSGLQLVYLVIDLFDIGFGSRSADDLLGSNLTQPVEAFLAHPLRENGDGICSQQGAVEGATAAVVARGRPYGRLPGWVELSGHEPRDEAAECSADLVCAGGKILADDAHNASLDASDGTWEFDIVHVAIQARFHVVVPRDAEQVDGIDVPEADTLELGLDLVRNKRRVLLLCEGGDDDVAVLSQFDGFCQNVFVDGHIKYGHIVLLLSKNPHVRRGNTYRNQPLSLAPPEACSTLVCEELDTPVGRIAQGSTEKRGVDSLLRFVVTHGEGDLIVLHCYEFIVMSL